MLAEKYNNVDVTSIPKIVIDFSNLTGETISAIYIIKTGTGDRLPVHAYGDKIFFECASGNKYLMWHYPECCEHVRIIDFQEDDIENITDAPVLLAEKVTESKDTEDGHCTWTFYKIVTNHGTVTLRWLGESNGYYSEEVDFYRLT